MELSSSLEDYLEAIYNVIKVKTAARATDIAKKLNVANSSVTNALQILVNRGLVNHAPYDIITLTPEGRKIAKQIAWKHEVFRDFFTTVLAIDPDTSNKCACSIEHIIPDEVVERFVQYLDFERQCKYGGKKWVEGFGFMRNANTNENGQSEVCIEKKEKDARSKK
ncbi:MAG: metal-dependent transcriptional regulator [Candidatus Aegiribacteria sp.]|nr:metal-dependent transcriptional regulator [Candidatus Aegiribacteria sp.]